MKRELMWIPFFGWYTWKAGMISVDRSRGSQALAEMNANARAELARNRQIIIFPEGTRRPPGAEPRNKYGVESLYSAIAVPCLATALKSRLFWPPPSLGQHPWALRAPWPVSCPPRLGREACFPPL